MKFRFSVVSLLLLVCLIGVASGWIAERSLYKRQLERTEHVLARWMPQEKAIQTAVSWKYFLESGKSDLKLFDQVINGDLIWVVEQAFELNDELEQLGYSEAIETAKEAVKLLGCSSPSELRDVMRTFYADPSSTSAYPFLYDEGSKEFRNFEHFLTRVFE